MANPTIVGLARILNARGGWFHDGFEDRGSIGPHEQCRLYVQADGSFAVKSPDDTEWLSWKDSPTGVVLSWRRDEPGQPGPWELWRRDPDIPTRLVSIQFPDKDFYLVGDWPATTPVLTLPTFAIRNANWYDGDRLFVPRFADMLSALRPERTAADWDRYLDWVVATGFNGVRVFAGALEWADQSADGAADRLTAFLDAVTKRGVAVEVTAITDSATGFDWREHLRRVLDICRTRQGVVVEAANEVGHGTQAADLTNENIREVLNDPAWDDMIVACGAPVGTDEPDPVTGRFAGAGGDFMTAHLDRGRDFWNQCRRVRELFANVEAEDAPCLNNEPLGAAEQDGSETGKQRSNEPPFFATLGALDRAFPGVGGVHHNDAGLDAIVPGPVQQTCADAYVAAHRAVEAILPGLVGRYYNAGHEGSPVARYTEDEWANDIIRHYSFTSGVVGASIVVGLKNPNLKLAWQNGWNPTSSTPAASWARSGDGSQIQIWAIAQ